jgi:uncharacterized membrane protein YphA (DoxX/SURF4 family)
LLAYLSDVELEIAEYQHELFRIEQMRKSGSTGELAFHDQRIVAQESGAAGMVQPWLAEVAAIERGYYNHLYRIYRAAQEERGKAAPGDTPAEDRAPAAAGAPQTAEKAASSGSSSNDRPASTVIAKTDETIAAQAGATELEGLPPSPAEAPAGAEAQAPSPSASDATKTVPVDRAEEKTAENGPAEEKADQAAPDQQEESSEDEQGEQAAPKQEAAPAQAEVPLTIRDVLVGSKQAELALVDKVVTWSHVAIGACLILGFFTPIASLAGAIFLAMVISTQPPWVPGTQETYYQFVEMFSLLVLAATCAGRWAGLDYFFACLFGKCGRS